MPVSLSPRDGLTNQIQIGCNIRQLLQLFNVPLAAKRCRGRRPISLTTGSLSRSALAGAEGHLVRVPIYRPQSSLVARRAPSAIASNFAQQICALPTRGPRPQSVPAMTFSRPTILP